MLHFIVWCLVIAGTFALIKRRLLPKLVTSRTGWLVSAAGFAVAFLVFGVLIVELALPFAVFEGIQWGFLLAAAYSVFQYVKQEHARDDADRARRENSHRRAYPRNAAWPDPTPRHAAPHPVTPKLQRSKAR